MEYDLKLDLSPISQPQPWGYLLENKRAMFEMREFFLTKNTNIDKAILLYHSKILCPIFLFFYFIFLLDLLFFIICLLILRKRFKNNLNGFTSN